MQGVSQAASMQPQNAELRPSTVPLSQPVASQREVVEAPKPVVAVKEESSVDLEDPYAQ